MNRKHYVYRLDADSGEFYIGVHSSDPKQKDSYMGSGLWCQEVKSKGIPVKKTVLQYFDQREDACLGELSEISKNWGNPKLMNRKLGSIRRPGGNGPIRYADGKKRITVSLTFTIEEYEALIERVKELGHPWTLASLISFVVTKDLHGELS